MPFSVLEIDNKTHKISKFWTPNYKKNNQKLNE